MGGIQSTSCTSLKQQTTAMPMGCLVLLTRPYMESVVHLPFATIVILPSIQYVYKANTGMYRSGALISCRGDLKGWPPVICTMNAGN